MSVLRRFASYYRPHRRLFVLDFGCAVLSGLLELAFPLAVSAFVDRLLPGRDWGLIAACAAGLAALYLVNTALMAIVTYWGHVLGIALETEMRARAFAHLQKLSFSFYDEQKTGHLIARVTKDLEDIGEVAHHGPEDLFIAVMTFIGGLSLGAIRNKLGDAHSQGPKRAKPQTRHAELAVNLAGTMATFLIATWEARSAADATVKEQLVG